MDGSHSIRLGYDQRNTMLDESVFYMLLLEIFPLGIILYQFGTQIVQVCVRFAAWRALAEARYRLYSLAVVGYSTLSCSWRHIWGRIVAKSGVISVRIAGRPSASLAQLYYM